MTQLGQPQSRSAVADALLGGGGQRGQQLRLPPPRPMLEGSRVNVGDVERSTSLAAGSILVALGLARRSLPGALVAGVGGAMVYRGLTGHCHMYDALGIDTARKSGGGSSPQSALQLQEEISDRGIHVEQAFLINRSPADLYGFWRDFGNLSRIMSHVKSVTVLDDRRSHWVADAPALAGGRAEWDAEITADEPNARIAWRSLPGSQVENAGEVRFSPAMGDRGTEVHVSLDYVPPAGRLGHYLAKVFGKAPRRQIREDLRRFKQLMEIGEIPTIDGQPHGTCTGQGTYYKDPHASASLS